MKVIDVFYMNIVENKVKPGVYFNICDHMVTKETDDARDLQEHFTHYDM